MSSSPLTQVIRIPLREAGGQYGYTGRYDGDTASRPGRHASKSRDNHARSIRKRQRRELNRIAALDSL